MSTTTSAGFPARRTGDSRTASATPSTRAREAGGTFGSRPSVSDFRETARSEFPSDLSKLRRVDGTPFYEDADGRRFSLTTEKAPGHVREQLRADALYRALGLDVPGSREFPDGRRAGHAVKVARVVSPVMDLDAALRDPTLAAMVKKELGSELAAHALLDHFSLFLGKELGIQADPGGVRCWIVRTRGALRFRSKGETKAFGPHPMGLWTFRDSALNPKSAELLADVTWKDITAQLRAIQDRRSTLLSAVSDDRDLQSRLNQRLETIDYLVAATEALQKAGIDDALIERKLRTVLEAEAGGSKRPDVATLVSQMKPPPARTRPRDEGLGGSARSPRGATFEDRIPVANARLNDVQKEALRRVRNLAKDLSERSRATLSRSEAARTRVLGDSGGTAAPELTKIMNYVREGAPLHIYFNPDKMLPSGKKVLASFLESGRYMNQFETKISGGSLAPTAGSWRDGWERELFQGAYHEHGFVPEERPKYGAMALESVTAPGVSHYGNCFLVLNDDVRPRVTWTAQDSASCKASQVGTLEHSAHVLESQGTNTFPSILRRAEGITAADGLYRSYREIQVHGPVEFEQDIAQVVAPQSFRESPSRAAELRAFAREFDVPLAWLDGVNIIPE